MGGQIKRENCYLIYSEDMVADSSLYNTRQSIKCKEYTPETKKYILIQHSSLSFKEF